MIPFLSFFRRSVTNLAIKKRTGNNVYSCTVNEVVERASDQLWLDGRHSIPVSGSDFSLRHSVQTGYRAHPPRNPLVTGSSFH